MADLNANINVGIETTQALNQLKALQKQISQFHQSVAKSSATASVAQRDLQKNFLNSVNSIQGFSAELRTVRSTAESFTNSLEKNKFSMREYFRYAGGATKTFGKNFAAEFSTIERTAIERVKSLQTQYIKMGRDASGAMQSIAIRPTVLDMKNLGTQTAIAAQKQVLFNQLVKQGSTNLLNFGKNTQWAGRQLMVGFTLPLATLGMTAGRVFFDMEKAAIKFKKVYGDLFTAPEETKQAMESIVELGQAYAAYGVAVSDSLSIAADAAAAGFAGVDLQNQTAAALKLSVLGQLELQKALETTISLQNAFQLSSEDLAGEIDFLNAVENQTVVSLDDITEAVPRVAPVIKQLGGDVRDLAFFLAAMKEGGVNAAQGANALKSGLASLINPSEKSAAILSTLGINIKAIVEGNQGDIAGTVTTFAKALDGLDPLRRAQAIEQLFGKFQFARISALFDNITREGTQAQRVLELAGSTAEELANLSESELGVSAASSMNKFRKAIEQIKVALVPIGELFVQIATPFVEFGTEMLKAFNKLPDGVKTVIGTVITILGGIGPIALMTFGLINNGIANMIKFFATVRMGYLKITGQAKGVGDETQYMTQEQLEAAAAAASLDQAHAGLTQRFTAEKAAVDQLRIAYQRAAEAGARFTLNNPNMIKPGFGTQAKGFSKGGIVSGPGTGTSDSIPAMVSDGEAIIPAKQAKKYAPIIEGMIAGNIPGFRFGRNPLSSMMGNARVGTRMSGQSFIDSLRSGKTNYQSGFATGTGEDFLGQYGTPKKGQTYLRGRLEQSFLGVSSKTDPSQRPTFGFATSSALQRILNMAMFGKVGARASAAMNPLSKSLDRYGDISLITNKGVANRSTMYAGDSLLDYSRSGKLGSPAPMTGASKSQLSSASFGRFAQPFGTKQTGPNQFTTNPKPPYIETQTPGGFSFGEIEKIVTADAALASQLRTELVSAGFPNIKVGSPGFIQKMMTALGVPGFAKGGLVSGPGTGKSDSIPAMVSDGEAIIPAELAKKYGPLIEQMIAGNIPGYRNGRVGSGAEGRVGKSGTTVQRAYQGNVSASAGLVGFDVIDPNDLADLSSIYMKQIAEKAKVSVAAIDQEIKQWSEKNIEEINKATQAVNSGASATEAYSPLMDKFKKDMEESGGSVDKLNKTFKDMTPALQADLKEAQDYVKTYKLNIKETAADAEALKKALPDNMVAQMAGTPGGFGRLSKSRQALTAIQGGTSAIEEKGSPRFMLSPGQHPSSPAYKAASSQEHFSTTSEQELQKIRLAGKRRAESQSKAFLEGIEQSTQQASPSKKAYSIGANIGKGAIQGIESQEGNAKIAGTELAQSVVKTIPKGPTSTQASNFSSAFGNINTKEPVPAVGNAPRQVVQAISQEATATKSFVGDIKASFASIRANIAREFGWVKEEFKSLTGGVKANTSAASQASLDAVQKNLELTKAANNQLVVNGKAAGFNYVAAMAGRDGAVEAVVTKKTAEIVTKATAAYNSGSRLIPGFITNGLKSSFPEFEFSGENIGKIIAKSAQKGALTSGQVAAPLMSSVPLGPEDPRQAQAAITQATKNQLNSMQNFSSKMSTLSFGLSAATGVLSMFGGQFSEFSGVIAALTGGMFALMQITSQLAQSKGAELLMNRANAAGGFASLFTQFRGVSTGLKGFGKGIGGIFNVIKGAFPIASRLIPVLGGLLLAFQAFKFVTDQMEKQRQKVEGLGNAAAFSSDQIKNLGEKLNVAVQTIDYTTGVSVGSGGQSTSEQERTASFLLDPEFKVEYADAISGIEFATKEQAERSLASLATQLVNSGFDEQTANAIVAAIVQSAGRTDLKVKFKSIKIDSDDAAEDVVSQAEESFQKLNSVISSSVIGANRSNEQQGKEAQIAAGAAKASFDSLTLAFNNGLLSLSEYEKQIGNLFNLIQNSKAPSWLLDLVAEDMGIGDFVGDLDTLESKAFAVKAAVANIQIDPDDQKILTDASGTAAGSKERIAATKVMNKYSDAIAKAASNQQFLNVQEKEGERKEALQDAFTEQKESIEENDAAYKALRESGLGASDAIGAVGDAAFMEAWALATTKEEREQLIADYKELMGVLKDSPFEKAKRSQVGSGSNPIADAIKDLKRQKQEILNTSKAYSALSKSGMSAVEAYKFAQNPALMAAMNAGLKVGSKQWDEIIKRIKAAEAATNKWRRSTVQGQTEAFDEAYEKASSLFSIQEEVLDSAFEKATKADNILITSLENQIEGLNDQISGYSRSLDEIAEKEDRINDSYDKKTKALEQTKKINEDIIRQQKSQLSIADALSQGDVSAAASAIQQARSENAAAALEAQGNQLGLARDAQLAGVKSADGLTRTQIEEKVKGLKKQISDIEFGSLKTAQARVAAAEAELEKSKENVLVAGQTETAWNNQKLAIDSARLNAETYTKELKRAFAGAESIHKEWKKLDKDFTTTHRVNTIYTQEGSAPSAKPPIVIPKAANSKTPISSKGGSGVGAAIPFASGGKVGYYPMGGLIPYMADGGMFQSVNTDTVPAMLTPGEFVVRRSAVDKFGLQNLKNINNGTYGNTLSRGFNQPIYPEISRDYASANIGGGIYPSSDVPQSNTQVDNSVYNYSLSVNVEGTDASPDQIANVVMRKLQDFGSQRVRGQVVR
jgi:TP901 family phage tail tape measure protein